MQVFALLVCVVPHQSISVICHSPSGCQPSGALATTLSFLSSTNLLRVYYALSSRSLIKMLNRTEPSTYPLWCIASYWPLAKLCDTDRDIHSVYSQLHCVFIQPILTILTSSTSIRAAYGIVPKALLRSSWRNTKSSFSSSTKTIISS